LYRGLAYYALQFLLYPYESVASLFAFGMYPAAIRVATIAASVSVDMTLKINKNIEISIMRLPTVPRQCFTMMSMIRRGLVARFRMAKFTRMAALRLGNCALNFTQ
jgi:hypothetical protein